MRCGTESVLRRYGPHPGLVANQPGPELLDYLSGYSYDRSGWSATRRPNHQHRFLRRSCFSTRARKNKFALRIKMAAKILRFRMLFEPKSIKFGHWNPPNFRQIDAKGTAKAKLPPRLAKSMYFNRILTSFGTPDWSQKSWKFALKTGSKKQ